MAQSRPAGLKLSFALHSFEVLRTLVVNSHGGITHAALWDVTLSKHFPALPRYIVYVYVFQILIDEGFHIARSIFRPVSYSFQVMLATLMMTMMAFWTK